MAHFKFPALLPVIFSMICCMFSSCDGFVYENPEECRYTYKVRFRYDRNMKWADAFPREVTSVRLYAFDSDGVLVWHKRESGAALAEEGYSITAEVPPGDYTFLAWCGLDNGAGDKESFAVTDVEPGRTRIGEMICRMERSRSGSEAESASPLYSLYHGMIRETLPDLSGKGGEYTCTVPLTKDTNHVRIILQHLSGEPVDPDDFEFLIEEENGLMNYDNTLLPDEKITYRAYNTSSGSAGMGEEDYPELGKGSAENPGTKAITTVNVAIADLSIPRLVTGRKTYLSVRKESGELAARIPLTDYALMLKDGYSRVMTDQEFLDRQDDWALTFFLDEDDFWLGTSIVINSWRIVFNNIDFNR